MSYRDLPEALVARISPSEARRYVRAMGWSRVNGIGGGMLAYQDPTSDLEQVLIPMDPDASDYARRMAEVVSNLATREGRPAIELLNDLLVPPSDVIRFRIQDSETESGSLPLERGIELLQGTKRALLAAACSVIQPQAFHPRLSRAEAEDLVGSCRLGQTERGSFIISVACPLDTGGDEGTESSRPLFPDLADPIEDDASDREVPFTRKVTTLLMRSAAQLVAAAEGDDPSALSRPEVGGSQLSANFCDALLLMQPRGERSTLTVKATWSRAIRSPSQHEAPASVLIRQEGFRLARFLAQELRPARLPRPAGFIGVVDALFGDPDDQGRMRGDVQLIIFEQEDAIRARVSLGPEEYHIAWQAHGEARYVSLNGVLVFGGRVHRLERVQNFKLLGEGGDASS